MMVLALIVALNLPALMGLGALAFHQASGVRVPSWLFTAPRFPRISLRWLSGLQAGRRRSRTKKAYRHSRSDGSPQAAGRWEPLADRSLETAGAPSSQTDVSPARSRAEHAIRLAMQSRYHAAAEEFHRALQIESEIDLTSCLGFWRMQPMGYIAAAKGYVLNGQRDEARRLLTVVQLAFKSNPELTGLFSRAIDALDDDR
jgi:hypothetical protein